MMRVIAVLLGVVLHGCLAQIPPSAFIVGGGGNANPPPPPPPPGGLSVAFDGVSPSPPPPGVPAPAPSTPASTPAPVAATNAKSSGGSSLSGGAIAGIVIGAIVGVAIIGLLAFFVLRRRRASAGLKGRGTDKEGIINDVESGSGGSGIIPKRSSDLHDHLGALHMKPSGLHWNEGDEIKSIKTPQNTTQTTIPPVSMTSPPRVCSVRLTYDCYMPESIQKRAVIEESLSDYTPSHNTSGAQIGTSSSDGKGTSFVQVMPDKTSVIIKKGPGGAIHISQISNAPGSSGQISQASTVSAISSAATLGSAISSSVDLPDLPWSDWQLKADDIIFATDSSGEAVKLGSGAYGTVYKATIDGVTECACKVFHDVHNQLQQADILREVAILKSCRDRNIVQFLGACIMDERIMLVTELMEAGDLWHALIQYKDSGALSWYRRGKRIAIEVARGLHFLHRHKIIHFDLKSANVLLTRDGTAKVSDVGFANILSNTHLSNNVTAFTFAWAAPEVLLGQQSSSAVDIFSYGVLLWEIVTGLHPQRGQLRDCRVPEECPAEVEQLIQQCLSVEPTARPSCKEIVEILARVEDLPAPK